MTEIGFPSGGFAQLAGRQPVLCEAALRCAEEAGDHLRRHAAFLGHFPSRVGPLAAQPEEQANGLFLPRAELPQQPRYALEIHRVRLVLGVRFRGVTVSSQGRSAGLIGPCRNMKGNREKGEPDRIELKSGHVQYCKTPWCSPIS